MTTPALPPQGSTAWYPHYSWLDQQVRAGTGGGSATVLAPAPSGGDDYAALAAALPASGVLQLRAGLYRISGRLTVGFGQDIMGVGGNLLGAATTVRCTTSSAGITVTESAGVSGNLLLDANRVATAPFIRELGVNGAQRTFLNLSVAGSAQDNMLVKGAQNDLWLGCNAQYAARDNLVLDNGAGGHAFVRCEFNGAGRYHLRTDNQFPGGLYAEPTDNEFLHCIFEREHDLTGVSATCIYLASYDALTFTSCTIYGTSAATGPRVDIVGLGSVTFHSGRIMGDSNAAGTGVRIVNGARLVLAGQPRFENLAVGIHLVSGNPTVFAHDVFFNNVAARYGGSGTPDISVRSSTEMPMEITRGSTTDRALAVYRTGEAGVRFLVSGDGSVGFNDGVGYTPKAYLYTGGAGVLSMPATQVVQAGRGTTANRPTPSSANLGAAYFDTTLGRPVWSTGTTWVDPGSGSVDLGAAPGAPALWTDWRDRTDGQTITNATLSDDGTAHIISPTGAGISAVTGTHGLEFVIPNSTPGALYLNQNTGGTVKRIGATFAFGPSASTTDASITVATWNTASPESGTSAQVHFWSTAAGWDFGVVVTGSVISLVGGTYTTPLAQDWTEYRMEVSILRTTATFVLPDGTPHQVTDSRLGSITGATACWEFYRGGNTTTAPMALVEGWADTATAPLGATSPSEVARLILAQGA